MTYLENKCVWLTGATSGIGEALVFELVKRKVRLVITARRVEVLDKIAEQARQQGGEVHCFPGDVEDLESLKIIVKEVKEKIAPIDILIANAGNHIFTVPEKFNSAEYLYLMNLNYGGMLKCIEAVLPDMLERKSGHIAGMASMAGFRGLPRAAAYGASKAAMIHFLESIRFHLKNHQLSVSIINPGFVKTPLTDKNDFYMPFLISAERAAIDICNGLEKRKREINFPFIFSRLLKLGRFLPDAIYEKIVDRMW